MTMIRLLAPYTDAGGEPHAAGAVINVPNDEAVALNNAGKASLLEEEKKLEEQAPTNAVYDARLQRPEARPVPAPQEASTSS
jgi:hypothetical protein